MNTKTAAPYKVGDWLHCPETGHTARVVQVDRCSTTFPKDHMPEKGSCYAPVYMYLCETVTGDTIYIGHMNVIERVEEPTMTDQTQTAPDPWDAGGMTTTQQSDVVAAAVAEVADVVSEADAAITALSDEAKEASDQLAAAVDVINDDSTAQATMQATIQAACEAYWRMEDAFRGAVASARAHKATIKTLRAELATERAAFANLESTLQAERLLADDVASDANASEKVMSNELALAREQLVAANAKMHDMEHVHAREVEQLKNELTLARKLSARQAVNAADDELGGLPLTNPRAAKAPDFAPPERKIRPAG